MRCRVTVLLCSLFVLLFVLAAGNTAHGQGTGDFRVFNYSIGFGNNNYEWRGYAFTVSREVVVTHLWGGGGPNAAGGFQGGIYEASWTGGSMGSGDPQLDTLLRSVVFDHLRDTGDPPEEERVELSSPVTLYPGQTYFIAQGRVSTGMGIHYRAMSLDHENLVIGSPILDQWWPQGNAAYQPGGSGTAEDAVGRTAEMTTPVRILMGLGYETDVAAPAFAAGGGTGDATSTGSSTAVLEGLLTDPGAAERTDATTLYFEYSTDSELSGATLVPASPHTITGPGRDILFSREITGLSNGITYYYRVVAINEAGRTSGDIESFEHDGVTFARTVTASWGPGGTVTTEIRGVEVGDTTTFTVMPDDGNQVSPAVGGTSPAGSWDGNAYTTGEITEDGTVVFGFIAPPSVSSTAAVSNITGSSATSGGDVSSDGGADVTARGLVWSTSSMPTLQSHPGGDFSDDGGSGTGAFESNMADLDADTTYHVRAYAANSAGAGYGPQVTFNTDAVFHTLTYTADPNGSIDGVMGQTVAHGDDGTEVAAVPNSGYRFTQWSDGVTTAARVDSNVTEDVTVEAYFSRLIARRTISTSVEPVGAGTVKGSGTFRDNSLVRLEAVPASGYEFIGWLERGDHVETDPVYTFHASSNRQLVAVFGEVLPLPYESTVIDPDAGGVLSVPGMIDLLLPPLPVPGIVELGVSARYAEPEGWQMHAPVDGLVFEVRARHFVDAGEPVDLAGFDEPVTVTLNYQEELDPMDAERILVHYYHGKLDTWIPIPTAVDTERQQVVAQVDRPADLLMGTRDTFTDISGHWAERYVLSLSEVIALDDYPDTTFRPDDTLSREQFTRMLVDLSGRSPQPARRIDVLFDDVGDISGWARSHVEAAVLDGLVSGDGNDAFRPHAAVTRAEVAVMVSRALGLAPLGGGPRFVDAGQIPDWAAGHVAALCDLDIVMGMPGNLFAPHRETTRAEAAAFLSRYLEERSRR